MYRSLTFFLALISSIVATAQQSTMDKSSQSVAQTNTNITAAAIRMEDAGNILIDSATYHKAIKVGNEIERPLQTVELSDAASHLNGQSIGNLSKAEINNEAVISGEKTEIKSGRALKVIRR